MSSSERLSRERYDYSATVQFVLQLEVRVLLPGYREINIARYRCGGHTFWQSFFAKLGFHDRAIFVSRRGIRASSDANHHSGRPGHASTSSRPRDGIVAGAFVSHAHGGRNGNIAIGGGVLLQASGYNLCASGLRRGLGITNAKHKVIEGNVEAFILRGVERDFRHYTATVHVRHEFLPSLLWRQKHNPDANAIPHGVYQIAVHGCARHCPVRSGPCQRAHAKHQNSSKCNLSAHNFSLLLLSAFSLAVIFRDFPLST